MTKSELAKVREKFPVSDDVIKRSMTGVTPTGKAITVIVGKRIRQSSKPLMNKLEEKFYTLLSYRFKIIAIQSLRFRLGNGIWYKPDFVAFPHGFESQDIRLRAFEVKGSHAFRGGFENLKVAASLYPYIKWTLVWLEGGIWKEQTVLP